MKTLIACIALLTAFAAAAETDTFASLIKKALAIPAQKMLVGKVVDEVIETGIEQFGEGEYAPSFHNFFHKTRYAIYSQPGVGEMMRGRDDSYYGLRTIFVSKMKKWLHTSANLCDTYKENYSGTFRKKIESFSQAKKDLLTYRLKTIRGVFEKLKTPAVQEAFKQLYKTEQGFPNRMSNSEALAENLSEEKIAELIQSDTTEEWRTKAIAAEKAFNDMFEDANLAKFAGRRYLEGGSTLIDQYLALIDLMIADVK